MTVALVRRTLPALLCIVCLVTCNHADADTGAKVRVCTYNTSLHRDADGQLVKDLEAGSEQAQQIAEVLQRLRPDIVLLNEFDYDAKHRAATLFSERYLEKPQAKGLRGLDLPHRTALPVNTGVPSGKDLNKDGKLQGPADAFGFGRHPGQYGMLVLSRYPIDHQNVRSFQKLLWKSMPGASLPETGGKAYYSDEDLKVLRLSSKSHWDVPITFQNRTVHVLASHPTPPVFDGKEDRNGRRNFDEIRLWADYLSGGQRAAYIKDDQGRAGGLDAKASFVILGDLNADPKQGDSRKGAIQQLLRHPRVAGSIVPKSVSHGDKTADFGRSRFFRVDYALPSVDLDVVGNAVFWPVADEPAAKAIQASDHRPVWIDIVW